MCRRYRWPSLCHHCWTPSTYFVPGSIYCCKSPELLFPNHKSDHGTVLTPPDFERMSCMMCTLGHHKSGHWHQQNSKCPVIHRRHCTTGCHYRQLPEPDFHLYLLHHRHQSNLRVRWWPRPTMMYQQNPLSLTCSVQWPSVPGTHQHFLPYPGTIPTQPCNPIHRRPYSYCGQTTYCRCSSTKTRRRYDCGSSLCNLRRT